MPSERWYHGGLQFTCTQCGVCCAGGEPGYVWVTHAEIERLARHLGVSIDEFGRRYLRLVGRRYSLIEKPNYDCIFWNEGCEVYEARPIQCRTFPFWPENLRRRADWDEASAECPGMDSGRFYPMDEIEVLRRGGGETS